MHVDLRQAIHTARVILDGIHPHTQDKCTGLMYYAFVATHVGAKAL